MKVLRSGPRPQAGRLCWLRQNSPCAICILHDMKGVEVVRGLRSNPATRRARAVILTALTEAEIRDYNCGAKQMGIDEFISKPLKRDVLRGLLAKLTPSRRVSAK